MSTGNKLRQLRINAGKSSLEVSQAVGISRSALQMYEADMRRPRDDVKLRLSDYYHVPVQDIFF